MRLLMIIAVLFLFACKPEPTPDVEVVPTKEEVKEATPTDEKPEAHDSAESQAKKAAVMPADLERGATKTYGGEFAIEGNPVSLASVMEKPSETPVKVSGTIKKVCKKKGCWFTLSGPDVKEDVRVRMKDYGFFVPKNADGGAAVVEGVLTIREIPQDEAQHYADEAVEKGETPKKVDGPQKTFEFTATAVKISLNS